MNGSMRTDGAAVVGVDELDVPVAVVVPFDLGEDPHRLGLPRRRRRPG